MRRICSWRRMTSRRAMAGAESSGSDCPTAGLGFRGAGAAAGALETGGGACWQERNRIGNAIANAIRIAFVVPVITDQIIAKVGADAKDSRSGPAPRAQRSFS